MTAPTTSPMADPNDARDPLDELADEFLERCRRGEHPSVTEFAARLPEQVEAAREFLSALALVEGLKPRADETNQSPNAMSAVFNEPSLRRLGDFQILREIGRGGMGVVYEAEQLSLGRRVALKVLASGVARTSHQVQRFLREARSAAQLHHTNIVPVFGVGDQDGLYYYAMQFIRGHGLDKVLSEIKAQRGPTPTAAHAEASVVADPSATLIHPALTSVFGNGRDEEPRESGRPDDSEIAHSQHALATAASDSENQYHQGVARIGVQVARGLEYAHQQGTLHRDIKPSNLLLDFKGNVWIADFGLAKAVEDDDLTQTGDLVGTIRYMAPERFRGVCDARSDIHGLGLTLYEMLAMRSAFNAANRESLIDQMREKDPPRLRSINPSIPRDLETIVHKAIEREPAHRYANAGALADDLQRFLDHRPITARRIGSTERLTRWSRRNPGLATLGTAVAALLALTLVVIVIADLRLRREHAAALSNLWRAENAEADAVGKLTSSLQAQARAGRRSGLAGRRLESLRALQQAAELAGSSGLRTALRNEAIACIALADLQPTQRWFDGIGASAGCFDFDPSLRLVARGLSNGSILLQDFTTSTTVAELKGTDLQPVLARFGPGGRFLAVKHDVDNRSELLVWDVARRRLALHIPDGINAAAVDFHPDATQLAIGRRDGSLAIYDLERGVLLRRLEAGTVPHFIRFDPSGNRIAVASPNSDAAVQIRDAATGAVTAEWLEPAGAYAVDWHPKGDWLAAGGESGLIHLFDPDDVTAPPRILDGHDAQCVSLTAHPNGYLLASASWDGSARLWDTRSGRQLVQAPLAQARLLHFSDDGTVLGPTYDGRSTLVWNVRPGTECIELASRGASNPGAAAIEILKDLSAILLTEPNGVVLHALDDTSVLARLPARDVRSIAVDPQGKFVLTSGSSGILCWPIERRGTSEFQIGPPTPLAPLGESTPERMRLSRDGKTLAVIVDEERGRAVVIDLHSPDHLREIQGHANLERIDVSPDGRWVATGTWRGEGVKIWNAKTGELVRALPVSGSAEVVFGPDGALLLTGNGTSYDLWETETWTVKHSWPRDQAAGLPGVAAFRDDGKVLAFARSRTLVQLVDPDNGAELASLEGAEPRLVAGLRFSPDGRRLVVGCVGNAPLVWDLGAVRSQLSLIGLDWHSSEETGIASEANHESSPFAISVIAPPWKDPFERGEDLARDERWDEASQAYGEAIAAGISDVEAWSRLAFACLARGDGSGYRRACREILQRFGAKQPAPKTANAIAWTCAVGPEALDDYSIAIALAERAVASRPELNRLNTLGAILFRAGRYEEALKQLERSIDTHGAGGTMYDAALLAMVHHHLGHPAEARRWLARTGQPAPVAMRKPDAAGPSSWIPRLEIARLRAEAQTLIGGASPR